jgi:hypothetical protein
MPTDEQIWKMLDAWYQLIGRRIEPSAVDRGRDFAAMKRSLLALEEDMAGLNSLTIRVTCAHEWKDIDSQSDNAVKCTKCSMPGERQRDGTVYWPAT